jgi:hypothetical protein
MTSITLTTTTAPHRRVLADDVPQVCWCGQDLAYAEPGHCPRCGYARAPRLLAVAVAPVA